MKTYAWYFIAIMAIGVGIALASGVQHVAREIRATRTVTLCVHAWQMGLEPDSCDELLGKDKAP